MFGSLPKGQRNRSQQQQEEPDNKKVLVLYGDTDEKLAKLLVDYLQGMTDGLVFSCRRARYGCEPECYRTVVRLNEAEPRRETLDEKNVWSINVTPFEEAADKSMVYDYTEKKHRQRQADELAKEIAKRYQ